MASNNDTLSAAAASNQRCCRTKCQSIGDPFIKCASINCSKTIHDKCFQLFLGPTSSSPILFDATVGSVIVCSKQCYKNVLQQRKKDVKKELKDAQTALEQRKTIDEIKANAKLDNWDKQVSTLDSSLTAFGSIN